MSFVVGIILFGIILFFLAYAIFGDKYNNDNETKMTIDELKAVELIRIRKEITTIKWILLIPTIISVTAFIILIVRVEVIMSLFK